jgi:hypothetical protein
VNADSILRMRTVFVGFGTVNPFNWEKTSFIDS